MTGDPSVSQHDQALPSVVADQLYVLVYRSHSRCRDEAGVAQILRTARINNAALGITGALMLYQDWFAQVLEGPEEAVKTLFERIRADPRHHSVQVIDEKPARTRAFEKWAMAYVGEHDESDIPMMPVGDGLAPAAAWRPRPEQDAVLDQLRQATRGYGRGS